MKLIIFGIVVILFFSLGCVGGNDLEVNNSEAGNLDVPSSLLKCNKLEQPVSIGVENYNCNLGDPKYSGKTFAMTVNKVESGVFCSEGDVYGKLATRIEFTAKSYYDHYAIDPAFYGKIIDNFGTEYSGYGGCSSVFQNMRCASDDIGMTHTCKVGDAAYTVCENDCVKEGVIYFEAFNNQATEFIFDAAGLKFKFTKSDIEWKNELDQRGLLDLQVEGCKMAAQNIGGVRYPFFCRQACIYDDKDVLTGVNMEDDFFCQNENTGCYYCQEGEADKIQR